MESHDSTGATADSVNDPTWSGTTSGKSCRSWTQSLPAIPTTGEIAARKNYPEGWNMGQPARQHLTPCAQASRMTCYACHTSWTTSCFGCHLSMTANQECRCSTTKADHAQLDLLRFSVLRDDVYMLGIDGTVTATASLRCARRARSWSAHRTPTATGSIDAANRFRARFSGEAFSTYVPTPSAPKRPSNPPTVMCPRKRTTTLGWRRCWCKVLTS